MVFQTQKFNQYYSGQEMPNIIHDIWVKDFNQISIISISNTKFVWLRMFSYLCTTYKNNHLI